MGYIIRTDLEPGTGSDMGRIETTTVQKFFSQGKLQRKRNVFKCQFLDTKKRV